MNSFVENNMSIVEDKSLFIAHTMLVNAGKKLSSRKYVSRWGSYGQAEFKYLNLAAASKQTTG